MEYRKYETQRIMWDEGKEDGCPIEYVCVGQIRTSVYIRSLKRLS
jgi:hypothetical protein